MRRCLLYLSACFVCLPCLRTAPVHASGGHTEIEVVGYQGQSSADLGCGTTSRVRYGGGTVQLRHSQRAPEDPADIGAEIVGGVAVEADWDRVREEANIEQGDVSATYQRLRYVSTILRLAGGYQGQYVGVRAGLSMGLVNRRHYNDVGVLPLPGLSLRLGPRRLFYVLGGWDVPSVANYQLTGPYGGLGCGLGPRSRLELRVGAYLPNERVRIDADWKLAFSGRASLLAGLAVGFADDGFPPDQQAALGINLAF